MGPTICSLMPLIFLFLIISKGLCDTEDLINKVCGQTEDFKFCEDVFVRHLYTPETDIKGLTQIALTQTLIYTSNTLVFIDKARDQEKNRNVLNIYKICDAGYGLLLSQLQDANLAFATGDYRTVVFVVGKCERFVSDCQYVLGKYLPHLGERTVQNRVLVRMSLASGQLLIGQSVN